MNLNPTHLPLLPYLPLTPVISPPNKQKQNKLTNKNPTLPLFLSNTSSFIIRASGATMCHTVYPFCQISPTHKMFIVMGLAQGPWHSRKAGHASRWTLQQESWCCYLFPHTHRRADPSTWERRPTPNYRQGRTGPDVMGLEEALLA